MLEARLQQAKLLKSLLEAVRELVTECNFECNDSGIALQAMDNSHVALVAMLLRSDGFDPYRCDRNLPLGINLANLGKILKCARNDDILTLKADDEGDVLSMVFESKGMSCVHSTTGAWSVLTRFFLCVIRQRQDQWVRSQVDGYWQWAFGHPRNFIRSRCHHVFCSIPRNLSWFTNPQWFR